MARGGSRAEPRLCRVSAPFSTASESQVVRNSGLRSSLQLIAASCLLVCGIRWAVENLISFFIQSCYPLATVAMNSLVQLTSIVQPLLTLVNNSVETTLNSTFADTAQNATVSAAPFPTDFSSLMAFIYSISDLRDYAKLIVLGGAFETLRRIYSSSYSSIWERFIITATFDSEDLAFSEQPFHRGLFID